MKSQLFCLRYFCLLKGLGAIVMNGTSQQFRILTVPSGGSQGLINHLPATQAQASSSYRCYLGKHCVLHFFLFFFLCSWGLLKWRVEKSSQRFSRGSAASRSRCVYTLPPWEITASRTPLTPWGNICDRPPHLISFLDPFQFSADSYPAALHPQFISGWARM